MRTFEVEYYMYGSSYLTRRTVDACDEEMARDTAMRFDGVARINSIKILEPAFTALEVKEMFVNVLCEFAKRNSEEWCALSLEQVITDLIEQHPTKPITIFEE